LTRDLICNDDRTRNYTIGGHGPRIKRGENAENQAKPTTNDLEKPSGDTTALTSVISAVGPTVAKDGEIKERPRRVKNME
jgi:hypothetical protein